MQRVTGAFGSGSFSSLPPACKRSSGFARSSSGPAFVGPPIARRSCRPSWPSIANRFLRPSGRSTALAASAPAIAAAPRQHRPRLAPASREQLLQVSFSASDYVIVRWSPALPGPSQPPCDLLGASLPIATWSGTLSSTSTANRFPLRSGKLPDLRPVRVEPKPHRPQPAAFPGSTTLDISCLSGARQNNPAFGPAQAGAISKATVMRSPARKGRVACHMYDGNSTSRPGLGSTIR